MSEDTSKNAEVKAIFGSINKIQKEIPAIGKDSQNKQQGFYFRGIDAVYNVLKPLLSKYGVFTLPEVTSLRRDERQTKTGGTLAFVSLTMNYHFVSSIDGSEVVACVVGEGMDSGDKATNKAMSIAHKYALFQVFCIPTEDIIDPDSETQEPSIPITVSNYKNDNGHIEQKSSRILNNGDAIIHFGKNKGIALNDVSDDTLRWYAFTWNPDEGKYPATDTDYELKTCAANLAAERGIQKQPF